MESDFRGDEVARRLSKLEPHEVLGAECQRCVEWVSSG